MNRFDTLQNMNGLGGFLSKAWKSVKKTVSKVNKVRKKVTPKPLKSLGNEVGRGVRSIVTARYVSPLISVVGSLTGFGLVSAAAVISINAADAQIKKAKTVDQAKVAKQAFFKSIEFMFNMHPKDREKIYAQISPTLAKDAKVYLANKYKRLSPAAKKAWNLKVMGPPKQTTVITPKPVKVAPGKKIPAVATYVPDNVAKKRRQIYLAEIKKIAALKTAQEKRNATLTFNKWLDNVKKYAGPTQFNYVTGGIIPKKTITISPIELVTQKVIPKLSTPGGVIKNAAFDMGMEIGNQPEIKAVIADMVSIGRTPEQIMVELKASNLYKETTKRLSQGVLPPRISDAYQAAGIPKKEADAMAEMDISKGIANKSKQEGAILPLLAAGAAALLLT